MPVEQTAREMGLDRLMIGRSQMPLPVTGLITELYAAGYNEAAEREATMSGRDSFVALVFVEGWAYFTPRPISSSMTPAQALAGAAALIETRGWEAAFEMWPAIRDGAIAANRALQVVDISALDDNALSAHLADLLAHHRAMVSVHHSITGPVLIGVAFYLMKVGDWTGATPSELIPLLAGTSPLSRSASPECRAAAAAAGVLVFESKPAAQLVSELSEIAEVATFIDDIRCHVVDGFDLTSPMVEEIPQLIIDRLRAGARVSTAPAPADSSPIRARVPAEHRNEFDAVLDGARRANTLRDERGLCSDGWSLGLLRRGLLEVGRRLRAAGRLDDPTLLFECTEAEAATALTDPAFDQAVLVDRAARRAVAAAEEPPMFIGEPPTTPSPESMPAPFRTLDRIIGTVMATVLGAPPIARTDAAIGGVAASGGVVEGIARVLSGPHEIERLEAGEILVTPSTNESFNAVVHLVAGIVTDHGGINSHAGIVSREAGVPAVVGCGTATRLIPDGARIRVDGSAGIVTVLTD